MRRSSGGGFRTLSISRRGLQYSCALGLYVPRVALLLRAIMKNTVRAIPAITRSPTMIGTTIIAMSVGEIPSSRKDACKCGEIYLHKKNVKMVW